MYPLYSRGMDGREPIVERTEEKTTALINEAVPIFAGFCALHALFHISARSTLGSWRTREGHQSHSWLAYNATVLIFDILSFGLGVHAIINGQMASIGGDVHARIHGFSASASTLCALTCAFELYNTLTCVFMYTSGFAFIMHHLVTFTLCFISTGWPTAQSAYVHFYAIFFFGLSNASSIPLASYTVCETLKTAYPRFERPYVAFQMAFAALFLLVRVCIWPVVSLRFWIDSYVAFRGDWTHSCPATALLLLSNVFLTGLQFVWGRKVWRRVQKTLFSGSVVSEAGSAKRALEEARHPTSDEASSSDDGHDDAAIAFEGSPKQSSQAGAQKRLLPSVKRVQDAARP